MCQRCMITDLVVNIMSVCYVFLLSGSKVACQSNLFEFGFRPVSTTCHVEVSLIKICRLRGLKPNVLFDQGCFNV
jgi:hypothetical protein